MTDRQHPITPPPELVQQWLKEFYGAKLEYVAEASIHLAARATQWGADQELDACCAWLLEEPLCASNTHRKLRDARRKPPSLKEQALQALELLQQRTTDPNIVEPLRRALEQLDD